MLVIEIDKTANYDGCVTVLVLIHYFTLVAGGRDLPDMPEACHCLRNRYTIVLSVVWWGN